MYELQRDYWRPGHKSLLLCGACRAPRSWLGAVQAGRREAGWLVRITQPQAAKLHLGCLLACHPKPTQNFPKQAVKGVTKTKEQQRTTKEDNAESETQMQSKGDKRTDRWLEMPPLPLLERLATRREELSEGRRMVTNEERPCEKREHVL